MHSVPPYRIMAFKYKTPTLGVNRLIERLRKGEGMNRVCSEECVHNAQYIYYCDRISA
jgi:hypothetical protein